MFFSCTEKESDIPTPKLTFSDQVEADFESIAISCAVSGNVSADRLTIEYSKDQTLASAQKATFEKSGDSFKITITGLEIQTTYYYRYTVENKASVLIDETIRQFKTLDYITPIVTTGDATGISGTKATIEGSVGFTCGKEVLEKGFLFGKDKDNLQIRTIAENEFTLSIDGLDFETTYYYQAYAKSEIGTGYGEIKELKTCNAVSFKPVEVKNITASSAFVCGGVEDNGGIAIDEQGFRYSEGSSIDFTFVESTGESSLSTLKAATSYTIWFYAKTFEGVFESNKVEFTTSDGCVLFGETLSTGVTASSITVSSVINGDGGSSITNRGFVYGTNPLPTIEGEQIIIDGSIGGMEGTLKNLPANTVFYIRAFAENAVGVSYSASITVATRDGVVSFSDLLVSNIKPESAYASTEVTDDGGSQLIERGFCYSLNEQPMPTNDHVTVALEDNVFGANISSLNRSSEYYVRAYAKNATGTYYSKQKKFLTPSGVASLGVLSSTSVESVTASFSCDISSDGGSTISSRGFCFSTTPSPTIYGSKSIIEGGVGVMQGSISNLEPGTLYCIRAFAITQYDITYSNQIQITTMLGLPTMAPVIVSNIQPTSVTLTSSIAKDGDGYVLEKGYYYSTTPNPEDSGSKVYAYPSWDVTLNDLEQNTTYYVKSFATTQYGTSYSEQASFTTTYNPVVLSEISIKNLDLTRATIVCDIVSYGGNDVMEEGLCYSTSPGVSTNSQVFHADDSHQITLLALDRGTTYYVRRYVKNKISTFYSNETSFTTLTCPDNVIYGVYSVSASQRVVFRPAYSLHDSETQYASNQYSLDEILANRSGYWDNTNLDISNGWWDDKMLSEDEWTYLVQGRERANDLIRFKVKVGTTCGALLFPDTYPTDVTINDGDALSIAEFLVLESLGCVYLPYAGFYAYSLQYVGQQVSFWTSSHEQRSGYDGGYYYGVATFGDGFTFGWGKAGSKLCHRWVCYLDN